MTEEAATSDAPLISVVMPAHNVEQFVRGSVENVINQTCTNWELMLVDDGSTDNTPAICDDLARQDSRVHVIHQPNAGVCAARNAALDRARGTYIIFSDADDELPDNSFELRVALMDGAELGIGRYQEFGELISDSMDMPIRPETSMNTYDTLVTVCLLTEFAYQGYTCNKIFRRDIIEREQLRFARDISYNEDRLFCCSYALHCTTTHLTSEVVYRYRRWDGGTMVGLTHTMTDEKKDAYLSEFVSYDRMRDLVRESYPRIATYLAGDAAYRAVKLRRLAADCAPETAKACEELIRKYSRIALHAPKGMYPFSRRAKYAVHALLKR